MYQVPYRIWQKYCLIFAFKPPLIHLELQNTPQTLSGCITREYYRFWEFQHDRSTRTGLTVIKLHLLDFAPEPREICTILSCNPLDPLKSRLLGVIWSIFGWIRVILELKNSRLLGYQLLEQWAWNTYLIRQLYDESLGTWGDFLKLNQLLFWKYVSEKIRQIVSFWKRNVQ